MSYSVLEFQKLIDELVTLLGHNNNEDAREFYFNKLEDYFKGLDLIGKDSKFEKIIVLYYNISEYFTNPGASYFGIVTKEEIIDTYYSKEFQDNLIHAIKMEGKEKGS